MKKLPFADWFSGGEEINGYTTARGFRIRFHNRSFVCGGLEDKFIDDDVDWAFAFLFCGGVLLFGCTLYLVNARYAEVFSGMIPSDLFWTGVIKTIVLILVVIHSFVMSGALFVILTVMAFRLVATRIEREYHACEHKVIHLIICGSEITLSNLARMPRTAFACGTTTPVGLSWIIFTIAIGILFPSWYMVLGFIICPFLCLFLSWFVQFFFTTAEPSEERLEESLAVAKMINVWRIADGQNKKMELVHN